MARVSKETRLGEGAAQEQMAAEGLDQKNGALAAAVKGEMTTIAGIERDGARGHNATEAQIHELAELVDGEKGSLDSNKNYIAKYSRQGGQMSYHLLAQVLAQEMAITQEAVQAKERLDRSLESAQKVLAGMQGGEAFQALQSIASADELAMTSASKHEELAFWIEKFDRDQKGFADRTEQGFKDARLMQEISQAEMDQDRLEQKRHELQAQAQLEQRTQ